KRCGDIEIAFAVESQALGSAEPSIKGGHCAVGINLENAIVRAGDIKIAVWAKGEVIGRDADLQSRKDEDLLVARDFEDCAVAVANVKAFVTIKGDAGSDSHTFGVGGHGAIRGDPIHGAIVAGRDVHVSLAIEGDGCGIHQFRRQWLYGVIGIYFVDGDRNLLAAGTGEGSENVALGVEGRVADEMEVLRDWNRNFDSLSVAHMPVGGDDHLTGGRAVRDPDDEKGIGADDDGTFVFAELDLRSNKFRRAQS